MTDAFNETPLITTVQINADDDPLDNASPTCGYERCGGFEYDQNISNSFSLFIERPYLMWRKSL